MNKNNEKISSFVEQRNTDKHIFTAGPASLLAENITGLRPCFGRGDEDYAEVEKTVLNQLKEMTGHSQIVRMQGSASLALEIMSLNFLFGKVLIVSSGYYSDRLHWLANSAKRQIGQISQITTIDWQEMDSVNGEFDWVVSCYTETSCGLKLPIEKLKATSERLKARLMLDATASIGLEPRHDLADVIAYSSCKGLFGLTGAAFIAYNQKPTVEVDSFYLAMSSHIEHKMTGPYHAIASLVNILSSHQRFREAVVENKKVFLSRMSSHLSLEEAFQPLLCTHVSCQIVSSDKRAILYEPRSNKGGSVVCHLGEAHLAEKAKAEILNDLEIKL